MRKLLKLAVVAVLAVPLAASAAGTIAASRHNLGNTNSFAAQFRASTISEICVFCHTPHNAVTTQLLWNRNSNTTAGWAAGNVTSQGTTLPASGALGAATKNCLSCHDGTQSLGNVRNYGASPAVFAMTGSDVNASGFLNNNTYRVGIGGDLNQNHPVSIPYVNATYNLITSQITTASEIALYRAATTVGCSGSSVCTTGGPYNIRLYGVTTATAGIECGSCHEPHDTTYTMFLRGNNASSNLCQSCHYK